MTTAESLNQKNKSLVRAYWDALDDGDPGDLVSICVEHLAPDLQWNGPAPVNRLDDPRLVAEQFWQPLKRAIPDLRRQTHMMFGGVSSGRSDGGKDGRMWVCGTGYLCGTAEAPAGRSVQTSPRSRR